MATKRPCAMGYRQLGNVVSNSKRQNRCVFSGLSEDLLVEVLLRLPFKSFIQFQLVSKHWRSLISSLMCSFQKPWAFVYLTPTIYHQEKMRKLEFLTTSSCHSHENPFFKTDLPFLSTDLQQEQQQPWMSIEGSFNDLILCTVLISKCKTYYICNPLTKQYMVLPPPPASDSFYRGCSFICEPYTIHNENNEIQHSRLGEISSDFRFRVVLGTYADLLVIYSSETGLWTKHGLSCPSGICCATVRKVVASCGQILMRVRPDCHGSSAIMFDPFTATNNRIIQGRSVRFLSDHFDEVMKAIPRQDRLLLCPTLIIDGQPDPTLSVWELDMGALAKDNDHNNSPWRLIHQVAICEMQGGTTDEGNLIDWRKEVYVSEADPYSWKYKRSWIANFLKSALAHPYLYPDPYPPFVVKYKFIVSCVGFHPLDINVMFLLLSFLCTGDHHTSCLAMYDMHTKAINAVPEEQMPNIFCRFKLFHTVMMDHHQSLFPIVAQLKPTLI